ncbi:MAG: thiol reductant ABC exporter subunit CydC [Actinomycetaceae bacterium]|nr:thiol reductant ABC exporter subunit CydC [Actinomycetaceae bacterium]
MNIFLSTQERRALTATTKMLGLRPGKVALAVVLGCATLISAISLAAVSAWLIARASQMPPVLALGVATVSVRMFGIGRALFRYLQRLASHFVALSGVATLRLNVYRILASSSTSKVASLRRGDILARTGEDVDAVGDYVVKSLLPTIVTGVVGILTVGLLAFLSLPVALTTGACLIVAGVVGPLVTIRSARIAEQAAQQAYTELGASSLALLENATELANLGRLDALRQEITNTEDDIIAAQDHAAKLASIAAAIDNIAMTAAVIAAILLGIPAVTAGDVSAVALAVLVLTPLAAFEGTQQLAPAAVQLVHSAGAAVRIVELLGGEDAIEGGLGKKLEDETPDTASFDDIAPVLEAKDLAIGWPGGPVIASGITLTLKPGSRLAIVGPSGIGKSTLLFTLAGMLPPLAGSVTLGGHEISKLSRLEASRHITLTAEDAHIFSTSVLENLRVSKGTISDEEATSLLEQAGMGQWLETAPLGLSTNLGSGGTTISGGERRRILLARALGSPAPLMLLDEPGEHLDSVTSDKLVGDLLSAGKAAHSAQPDATEHDEDERGVLLVTHRLSALGAADEVLVLDRVPGETGTEAHIVQRGTHAHLLATSPDYAWAASQEELLV